MYWVYGYEGIVSIERWVIINICFVDDIDCLVGSKEELKKFY